MHPRKENHLKSSQIKVFASNCILARNTTNLAFTLLAEGQNNITERGSFPLVSDFIAWTLSNKITKRNLKELWFKL